MIDDPDRPEFAKTAINLASAGLGARPIAVTDEFFAPVTRMLDDSAPVFYPDKYDDHGKWMDGWESRRRRGPGHDHATIQLAVPGQIFGFDVDTANFTGNFPSSCRIEACKVNGEPDARTLWSEILPPSALGPSAHHFFQISDPGVFSHVRLHIYPDGGIARLRVYGRPLIDRMAHMDTTIDLASALYGSRVVAYSDAHYGNYQRILAPGRGLNMGDGWETRRRRTPGYDWIIIALGAPGIIESALVDTAFYKGNFPDACSIQAAYLSEGFEGLNKTIVTSSMFWDTILEPQKLSADAEHTFGAGTMKTIGPVSHVRLNIHPDGGISRLRLFGKLAG